MPTGEEIIECTLRNDRGTEAAILTLGATLHRLMTADRYGRVDDVVLGYDSAVSYLTGADYFGATVGRFANRIACGRFMLNGRTYQLSLNAPPNSEHGGYRGFHCRLWRVVETRVDSDATVTFSIVSADGDEGYPGELAVEVTYALSPDDALRIEYRATTRAPTVLNLTHHSYWNLAGAQAGEDALGHSLILDADAYTPVDGSMIPTGEVRAVAETAFDFRAPRVIGARMHEESEPQLRIAHGYDHNFVLRGAQGTLRRAAVLAEEGAGRLLEVSTTEPGLQFYSGNHLSAAMPGKSGRLYGPGDGIALEPQHYPDSPHHPTFPSTVLEPGRIWSSTTVFQLRAIARADRNAPDLTANAFRRHHAGRS